MDDLAFLRRREPIIGMGLFANDNGGVSKVGFPAESDAAADVTECKNGSKETELREPEKEEQRDDTQTEITKEGQENQIIPKKEENRKNECSDGQSKNAEESKQQKIEMENNCDSPETGEESIKKIPTEESSQQKSEIEEKAESRSKEMTPNQEKFTEGSGTQEIISNETKEESEIKMQTEGKESQENLDNEINEKNIQNEKSTLEKEEPKNKNKEMKDESKETKDESKETKDENKEMKDESKETKDENKEMKDESKEMKDENKEMKDENKEMKDESIEERKEENKDEENEQIYASKEVKDGIIEENKDGKNKPKEEITEMKNDQNANMQDNNENDESKDKPSKNTDLIIDDNEPDLNKSENEQKENGQKHKSIFLSPLPPLSSTPEVPKDDLSTQASSDEIGKLKIEQKTFVTGTTPKQQYQNTPPSEVFYEPQQVEAAFELMLTKNQPPPVLMRDSMMQFINRKKVTALLDSDYDSAEKCDEYMVLLSQVMIDKQVVDSTKHREQLYDNRAYLLKEEKRVMVEKWNEKIQKHKVESEERMNNLKLKLNEEILNFKGKWQNPEYIRSFNKPSNKLLVLRHQEKKMALSKRYEEAKETKRIADDLQQKEEELAQLLIEEKIRNEFVKLRDKQKRDIEKLTDFNAKSLAEMENQKKRDLQPYESAVKNLEVKKKTKPNSKLIAMPAALTTPALNDGHHTTANTPRTLSRLVHFRAEKKSILNLSPVDDDTFQRISAKATKSGKNSRPSSPASKVSPI